MTHLMAHGGPPGRRGPPRDANASGKGRNAPGGPPRATEGRLPLTARCVAVRLRCANTAARTAPDGWTRDAGQMGHYPRALVLHPASSVAAPPSAGAGIVSQLAAGDGAAAFLDWGGGLVWLAVPAGDDARHEAVRAALAESGGHATLIRAPAAVRAAVPVFQPQPDGLAALSRRVKQSFDPKGILNPGRIYPDC